MKGGDLDTHAHLYLERGETSASSGWLADINFPHSFELDSPGNYG